MTALKALVALSVVAVLAHVAVGTTYPVGGTSGWGMGTNYGSWAASQKFKTGDSIMFSYGAFHSVMEVSKADYDSCSVTSPLMTAADGATIVKLSSAGKRYFICGMPGHCAAGMKVEINTVAAAAPVVTPSPPPPPAKTPPPPAKTPPPPTPLSPTPSPKPKPVASPPVVEPLPPKAKVPVHPDKASAPAVEPTKPKGMVLEATAAPAPQKSAAASVGWLRKFAVGLVVCVMMVMLF